MIISGGETSSSGGAAGDTGVSEVDQLFKLLDKYCSNEQLRHLVKIYRPSERDYAVSGNRDHLKQVVRRLFDTGNLSRPKLLLERAEENGRQHIFLYAPVNEAVAARLNNFEAVEAVFLNGRTRSSAGLPAFRVRPEGVMVADMRHEVREGTKYSFWIYKLYIGSESWRVIGKPEIIDDEKIVRYKLRYDRELLIVKWHSFGLLELRIPTGNSRNQMMSIRQKPIDTIAFAIADGEAADTDSVTASIAGMATDFNATRQRSKIDQIDAEMGRLLKPFQIPVKELNAAARSGDIKWISVNETDYDLDGHKVTVAADSHQEDLYQNSTLADALEKLKECTRLNAVIHVREQPAYLEKLPVEFCPTVPYEFRIGAETSPEVVEFIVRRIWEFSKSSDQLPVSPVDSIVSDEPRPAEFGDIGFELLAQAYPYLANAMLRLQQWLNDHPTADYLDPLRA